MQTETSWKAIWERRETDYTNWSKGSFDEVYMNLLKLNGFDSEEISISAGLKQHINTKCELAFDVEKSEYSQPKSIFEVGCGSGAELLLFQKDGFTIGGLDYSSTLIKAAATVLECPIELIIGEAIELPTTVKYDYLLSGGVFSYFPDFKYAEAVLDLMLQKCRVNMGILRIFYDKKKEAFIKYKRSVTPDYEYKYKGLEKLFFSKEFFIDYAEKHDLDIKFTSCKFEGYWNSKYMFNCFMYKRSRLLN